MKMIAFSGIDCSGKSTQIELLCEHLGKNNIKYEVVWSRGGYTPGINMVKKIIRPNNKMTKEQIIEYSKTTNKNAFKRKVLFLAGIVDLWFYYSFVLRLKGIRKVIICDRYIWDTYIDYKMRYPKYDFERGFWWRLILKTMARPYPSFCLFIPSDESMRRSELKEEPFPEPEDIRKKRIEMYYIESNKGRWTSLIDATKTIPEVYEDILKIVKESLAL